jgi:hypothetical protein
VVGTSFFPRYLEPFSPERIVDVAPGDRRMLSDPDVTRAGGSVLKVRGTNDCGRGIEGSGSSTPRTADDQRPRRRRCRRPQVIVGEESYDARVVFYDADSRHRGAEFDGGDGQPAVHARRRPGDSRGTRSRSSAIRWTGRSTSRAPVPRDAAPSAHRTSTATAR